MNDRWDYDWVSRTLKALVATEVTVYFTRGQLTGILLIVPTTEGETWSVNTSGGHFYFTTDKVTEVVTHQDKAEIFTQLNF